MSEAQFTPNLIASGTIRPFRFVTLDGADNSCAESNANELVTGVTTGSTRAQDSANHAESGDEVNLQTGKVVLVESSGTINAGTRVKSNGDGEAAAVATSGTTNQECAGWMLEDSTDGAIVRMYLHQQVIRPAAS